MKRVNTVVAMLLILSVLVLSACTLFESHADGELTIQFAALETRAIFTPSISMDIASYRITFTGPDSAGGESNVLEVAKTSSVTLRALAAGQWTIAVEGYNGWNEVDGSVSGQQIAYLSLNASGERTRTVSIHRGARQEIALSLVPLSDGAGSLTLTVNWPQLDTTTDSQLILDDPRLEIAVRSLNDLMASYAYAGTELEPLVVTDATATYTHTYEDLVPGWYEIRTTLIPQSSSGDADRFYNSLDFAHVVPGDGIGTVGSITITEAMIESGSTADWIIEEQMLHPLQNLTIDLVHPDPTLYTGIDLHFSTPYESETAVYQWFVDGESIPEATGQTFTWSFSTHGTHSVLLAVLDAGVYNGAVKQVTVEPAYRVGSLGEAGGLIFYEDTEGAYPGWTYLEAAPDDLILLDGGALSCDASDIGYDSAIDSFIFGYYRETVDDSSTLVGTGVELGTGEINTAKLVEYMGTTAYLNYRASDGSDSTDIYAAKVCADLIHEDFDDWFLPSRDEMIAMFQMLHCTLGIGGFETDGDYWSSSEYTNNAVFFREKEDTMPTRLKHNEHRVRPVRSF